MTRIIRAKVNPQILVWAREQAGVTPEVAARKAGVPVERLLSWETGAAKPTLRQARLLAKTYRRPSAFFYLSSPPGTPPELTDFRRLPDRQMERTSDLLDEVRRARFRREIALEVLSTIGEEIPEFALTASQYESPEKVGKHIRDYLDVSQEEQLGWHNPYEALSGWLRAVESSGALVFQFSGIDVSLIRGFSISEYPLPVISLNGKDAPHARIFTLIHEVCHLALGVGGLCDLHTSEADGSPEAFCNAAAAEALVPSSLLLGQAEVVQNREEPYWSDDRLQALSRRFRVSREVILRRLLSLGRTTSEIYQIRRKEFQEEYARLRGTQGGYMRYHKRILRNNGVAFTSLLMNAYYQQAITAIDVSRYLGDIRLNHLGSIQYELAR